ncbi:hypothetical protein COCVIDRAFT_83341, partial [Bipolaris victoriae FI3]
FLYTALQSAYTLRMESRRRNESSSFGSARRHWRQIFSWAASPLRPLERSAQDLHQKVVKLFFLSV